VSRHDLIFALTNHLPGTAHYLDTETGEVTPVFSFHRARVLAAIRDNPGRYLRLAPQTNTEGIHIMTDFIRTVTRADLREQLTSAIAGDRPFARFRRVIMSVPDEYRRWQQFHSTVSTIGLREKLLSLGIQLELIEDDE
jgi:hypothetical protein